MKTWIQNFEADFPKKVSLKKFIGKLDVLTFYFQSSVLCNFLKFIQNKIYLEMLETVEQGQCHFLSPIRCITHGNMNLSNLGFHQFTASSADTCDVDSVG